MTQKSATMGVVAQGKERTNNVPPARADVNSSPLRKLRSGCILSSTRKRRTNMNDPRRDIDDIEISYLRIEREGIQNEEQYAAINGIEFQEGEHGNGRL